MGESPLPEVTALQVVQLQPGDILAIRSTGRLTREEAERIRAYVAEKVPVSVRIMVLDSTFGLDAYRVVDRT